MAGIEFPAELQKRMEETAPVDLLVGLTGEVDVQALRAKAKRLHGLILDGEGAPPAKIAVAYAGAVNAEPVTVTEEGLLLAVYPMPAAAGEMNLWRDVSRAQRSVLALAATWQARACMVVYSDQAALEPEIMRTFAEPVLKGGIDLVMPVYPAGKYDALINKSVLAPMSRALYGRRVRWPLAADYCAGAKMPGKLADGARARSEAELLWTSNMVAMNGGQINQATLNVRHAPPADGLDLNVVLRELVGSLFEEAEANAAQWQRARTSQVATRYGDPCPPVEHEDPIDPHAMVESFVIASQNLEEVWRLVLPPATVLELKRLARLEPEQFRMPDALWARIIYDFALAHRMRRVSRTHVLGALTPLYLGWVAGYVQEVAGASSQDAERRVDQVAKAFEEQKPYFVSRWRWPERAV
jgi:glucosylglycerate synthase